jgi:uncharacterized protein (DUF1697 family)
VPPAAWVALLRGINVGPHKRIAMPALRETLSRAGFENVRTYVQSGNVLLRSTASELELRDTLERLIHAEFGFEVDVLVRTDAQLAQVVANDPLGEVAQNPKRYQVTFLSAELEPTVLEKLNQLRAPREALAAHGREIYAWHPDGAARSKLWAALAGNTLGVTATSRNWTTVTTLLAMAQEV